MNQAPIISVCIANYNGMGVIDECLESVLNQSGGLAVEVIIHDDASSDGSVTHIQRNHPDAILIESEENVGFCVANNRMAIQASGEYLLLLNNDATLYPDAISTLMRTASELGDPAILGLPQYDFDSGKLLDRGSLLDPFLNPVPNLDPGRAQVGMVMGACLWIPRNLWQELGGFPEWFGSIGEDLYLCCRARLVGYQVRVAGGSGFRHRVGASFGGGKVRQHRLTTTSRRRALSERNKSYTIRLCHPGIWSALTLCLHLPLLALEGALLSLLRPGRKLWRVIYLPCFLALWRKHTRLRELRRQIQGQRHITAREYFGPFTPFPYKLKMLLRHGLPQVS